MKFYFSVTKQQVINGRQGWGSDQIGSRTSLPNWNIFTLCRGFLCDSAFVSVLCLSKNVLIPAAQIVRKTRKNLSTLVLLRWSLCCGERKNANNTILSGGDLIKIPTSWLCFMGDGRTSYFNGNNTTPPPTLLKPTIIKHFHHEHFTKLLILEKNQLA